MRNDRKPPVRDTANSGASRLVSLLLVLAMVCLPGVARAQDTIALRSSVNLEKEGPITLAQIADVQGPEAERLGAVVIETAEAQSSGGKDGWITVELDRVRQALEAVKDLNWGRLTLRGSACSIRLAAAAPAPIVVPEPAPAAIEGPIVRDLVTQRLCEAYNVDPDSIKLAFDTSDDALLNTSTLGLVADVQLNGTSERQPVMVRLYRDLTTVASGQVRVGVSIKRGVAVCVGGARRGQTLGDTGLVIEDRWISPTTRPARAEGVSGQIARGRINPGQVIEESDIEPPVVIKKGEMCDVTCLAGAISLKVQARALEPGRLGQETRFQKVGSTGNFLARVDGPGRAVTGTSPEGGRDDATGESIGKPTRPPGRSAGKTPPAKPSIDERELARLAAREADRRRNRFRDMGDLKLSPPSAVPGASLPTIPLPPINTPTTPENQ